MKKILNLLTAISLITVGASNVAACDSNQKMNPKFDPFNLNTWGTQQRQIISKEYIKEWKSWYNQQKQEIVQFVDWRYWFGSGSRSTDSSITLNNSLKLINPLLSADQIVGDGGSVVDNYLPNPSLSSDTKIIFTEGLNLYVASYKTSTTSNPFSGKVEVNLKL